MIRPIRILELRSVRGTGGGPEKTILLGAARADRERYAVTVCYIRDLRDRQFSIDGRAHSLGLDYVEVCERHSFDPRVVAALRRLVRERAIHIVHGHEHKTSLLALLLARTEGVIPLATAHGWSGRSWRERVYYFFEQRLLARFPMVIAVSEPIRRTLIQRGASPARVRRIPNGIETGDLRRDAATRARMRAGLGLDERTIVIGSVGRLEPVKRFDVLLEAVSQIPARVDLVVVVAGEGTRRQALMRHAAALRLAGRLRLLGHHEQAGEILQAFDVYVQSSDSEGIPNAVLEAMACETPVVATDVGGTREVIDDDVHGLLVPRRNPAALARAITRTLADPHATSRRRAAARARVERELSFASRMDAVERLYDELVRRHGWRVALDHQQVGA